MIRKWTASHSFSGRAPGCGQQLPDGSWIPVPATSRVVYHRLEEFTAAISSLDREDTALESTRNRVLLQFEGTK